jgi:hypothetical protein
VNHLAEKEQNLVWISIDKLTQTEGYGAKESQLIKTSDDLFLNYSRIILKNI